jgi:hypothetical protein
MKLSGHSTKDCWFVMVLLYTPYPKGAKGKPPMQVLTLGVPLLRKGQEFVF